MQKRGFEIAFNWVFIAIVGAVLILMILSMIPKAHKAASNQLGMESKDYFDSIFKTLLVNTAAEKDIPLSGLDMTLTCGGFTVDDADFSTINLGNYIFFGPDLLKKEIVGYSTDWEIPFKAENFGYLSSTEIKYLVHDSASQIYGIMPENLDKEVIHNYDDFDNTMYYKLRYITFDDVPSASALGKKAIASDKDISLLHIELLDGQADFPNSYGKVTYYVKDGSSFRENGEVYFADRATLLAAIYSENPDIYACNMEKAVSRLRTVSKTKEERIQKLKVISLNPADPKISISNCPYDDALSALSNLESLSEVQNLDGQFYQNLFVLGYSFKFENNVLQELSCPEIY